MMVETTYSPGERVHPEHSTVVVPTPEALEPDPSDPTIEKLNQLLPDMHDWDPDLVKVVSESIDEKKQRLDEVIERIELYRKKIESIEDANESNTPTTSLLEKSHYELLKKVEGKIRSDIASYRSKLNPIARLADIASPNRSGLYDISSPLASPFKDIINDAAAPYDIQDDTVNNLSTAELEQLESQLKSDIDIGEEYANNAKAKIQNILAYYGLPDSVSNRLISDLSGKLNPRFELGSTLSTISRELIRRKQEIRGQGERLAKDLSTVVQSIVDFYDPIIKPKYNRKMPESVWWNRQVLELFEHAQKRLDVLNFSANQKGYSDILKEVKIGKTSISKKLEDILYLAESKKDQLDLSNSEDILYHSTSDLNQIVKILLEGKLRSLGSIRRDIDPTRERSTDNQGSGKSFQQEQHQIYFNSLGDDTFPNARTRDVYSAVKIPTKPYEDNTKITSLLRQEVKKSRESRARISQMVGKYGIKEFADSTRFCEHPIQVFNQETYGLDDRPSTFYIASGFFFRKSELLTDRNFIVDDGIGVFDSDYKSPKDDKYFEVNWKEEGCFVTDELGWEVIKHTLINELNSLDKPATEINEVLAEIEENVLILPPDLWGSNFVALGNIYTVIRPDVELGNGQTVSSDEIKFLTDYDYLDEYDKGRKQALVDNHQIGHKLNDSIDRRFKSTASAVNQFLGPPPSMKLRITPTLKEGEVSNAAGTSPMSSLYRVDKQ